MRTLTAWMPIVIAGLIVVCIAVFLWACSRFIMKNVQENRRMRVVFADDDADDEENQNDEEEWINVPPSDKKGN